MHRSLKPFTTLDPVPAFVAKMSRSLSVSSSISSSSSSSAYSRCAEDMIDRLAAQEVNTPIHLWSAGNLRLGTRDLTIPAMEAANLIEALKNDTRFEVVSLTHFDSDGEDWKISFRRAVSTPNASALSDSE